MCLYTSYIIIENIPASFEKIKTEEHDTDKVCMEYNNQTANIVFALDPWFINSDFNTADTL